LVTISTVTDSTLGVGSISSKSTIRTTAENLSAESTLWQGDMCILIGPAAAVQSVHRPAVPLVADRLTCQSIVSQRVDDTIERGSVRFPTMELASTGFAHTSDLDTPEVTDESGRISIETAIGR
jgi:hypothetical protein